MNKFIKIRSFAYLSRFNDCFSTFSWCFEPSFYMRGEKCGSSNLYICYCIILWGMGLVEPKFLVRTLFEILVIFLNKIQLTYIWYDSGCQNDLPYLFTCFYSTSSSFFLGFERTFGMFSESYFDLFCFF